MTNKCIATGCEYFAEFSTENAVYVDKTSFIEELLEGGHDEITLLTRPRRFGAQELEQNGKTVIRIGIAFHKKQCRVRFQ